MSGSSTLFGWKGSNSDLEKRVEALENASAVAIPLTTKGDLLSRDSSTLVRVPIGVTNNNVLTVDSTTATGLNWKTPLTVTSGAHTANILATNSTSSNAIINGLGVTDPNFITLAIAPFPGGDIILNTGPKVVLTDNTVTLSNKTLTSPNISQIVNTGTLTLPTTTGTLALVSQIPTNSTYVDLSSSQNITGAKTFSTAPVMSSISNSGNITIPSGTDTLVNLSGTQTLSNKTLTNPTISTINSGGSTVTLPVGNDTLANLAGTQTLTNKLFSTNTTIVDSALTIRSASTGKQIEIDSSLATNSTTTVLQTTSTATRFIGFPDATTVLTGTNNTATLSNKTIDTGSNTLTVASTALTSIIAAANPLLASSTPQFARLGLGVASDQAYLLTNDVTQNDKIVLWRGGVVNSNQFFGMGLGTNMQRYQVNNSASDHVFYCGASTTTSTELFRVKGSGGIVLPTTGGTAGTLSYYETGTMTIFFTGPASTGGLTCSFQRSGNRVTLYLPTAAVTASSSTFFTSGTSAIPTRLLPVANQSFPIFVEDMTTFLPMTGECDILTTGTINIYKVAPTGAFTGSLTCGWKASTFTWLIA